MNQKDMILNHIMKYGSITPREASELYSVMRLGARIYELKCMGFAIKKETVKATNRFGDPVHFARYTMDRKEKMQ